MLFAEKNVALAVPFETAHAYLADVHNLPQWTNAFAAIAPDGSAKMRTPKGEVSVDLEAIADREKGIIDWRMTFPDGSLAVAHSRLVALENDSCAYSFILTPPPVPLEELEGALDQQTVVLEQELQRLKAILED